MTKDHEIDCYKKDFDFEKFKESQIDWLENIAMQMGQCPSELIEEYNKEVADGVPSALGWCFVLGWYIIQTSGQGPYIVNHQKKHYERKKKS